MTAYAKMFASSTPGSTSIVVNVSPVEGSHCSKMQDWQLGGRAGGGGCGLAFVYQPFQKRIHGNALPPGFANETGFGFMRDFNTHGTAPIPRIPLMPRLRGVEIANGPGDIKVAEMRLANRIAGI